MDIVLASGSPSRLSILRSAGVEPLVHPTDVDEETIAAQYSNPEQVVAALASAKATAVDYPDKVVIGCDSMLLIDGLLQGKPHTPEATVQRWKNQAGKVGTLLTGHCIIYGDQAYEEVGSTKVHFAHASEADIEAYAATGEPLKCAGAFTLEALGGWFIDRIDGDPSSVIGLSLPLLRRALYSFGLEVSPFWNR